MHMIIFLELHMMSQVQSEFILVATQHVLRLWKTSPLYFLYLPFSHFSVYPLNPQPSSLNPKP